MAELSLSKVTKSFGSVGVLRDIDLAVADGEFVVFVGPSGCGKSTLLRIIAGLETADSGTIRIGGVVVNDTEPAAREIAMVFQSYALYPHMTVYENMAFGLTFAKIAKRDIRTRVERAADILKLGAVLDRKPGALSGGQRQRVAIGRAIVRDPKVFLFDEPLSNLDAALRVNTRIEIARLHRDLGATMIYVTHDQVEAMTLADKIVVLNEGRIEQVGSPLDLYHAPANRFVAGFIGSPAMNFVQAEFRRWADGTAILALAGRDIEIPAAPLPLAPGAPVTLAMRPEHFAGDPASSVPISGTADVVEHLGETSILYLRLADGQPIVVRQPGDVFIAPGQAYTAHIPAACLHAFDGEGNVLLGRRAGPQGPGQAARPDARR